MSFTARLALLKNLVKAVTGINCTCAKNTAF